MDYRTTAWPKCKSPWCLNPGRYDSGYCALCDIELNGARGEKVPPPICARCHGELGARYYQNIPEVGNLCLPCWDTWLLTRPT